MGIHCAGPNRQHYVQKADQTIRTASKKEFSLARADCELQDTATFPPSTAILSILTVAQNCNEMHKLFNTIFYKVKTSSKQMPLYKHDVAIIITSFRYNVFKKILKVTEKY